MVRRTLDGALKCALRDFLREEWRAECSHPVSMSSLHNNDSCDADISEYDVTSGDAHTAVNLRHG